MPREGSGSALARTDRLAEEAGPPLDVRCDARECSYAVIPRLDRPLGLGAGLGCGQQAAGSRQVDYTFAYVCLRLPRESFAKRSSEEKKHGYCYCFQQMLCPRARSAPAPLQRDEDCCLLCCCRTASCVRDNGTQAIRPAGHTRWGICASGPCGPSGPCAGPFARAKAAEENTRNKKRREEKWKPRAEARRGAPRTRGNGRAAPCPP